MALRISNFVTRGKWGARKPEGRAPLPAEAVRFLVLHYSGMDADEQRDHANCAARVRGVQNFHMDTRGWSDIAYNWLVCRHGYIFQGRTVGVRSAATGDANDYTVALCFLGDDTRRRRDVTPEAKEAIRNMLRFSRRHCPNLEGVRGHRDFMTTSCPGAELHRYARFLTHEYWPA